MADIRPGCGVPATGTGLLQGLIDSPAFSLRLGPADMARQEIVNKVHENRGFFESQCQTFAERVKAYAERLVARCEKQRAALLERLGENAFHETVENGVVVDSPAWKALCEEEAAGPPKHRWVWEKYRHGCCSYLHYWTVREKWIQHWRPPEDTNPLLWFATAQERRPRADIFRGWGMAPTDQGLHDAVVLAIAHDLDPSLAASEPRVFDRVKAVPSWPRDKFFREVNNALNLEGGEERLQRAWVRAKGKAQEASESNEASPEEPPVYVAINAAAQAVTFGCQSYKVTSVQAWDFLKTLISNKRNQRITPRFDDGHNWKNAVDTLRRQIGKENLRLLIVTSRDGYYLQPSVEIKYSAQRGIRRTKR